MADPKIETVEMAGHPFVQTTYPNGTKSVELGEFEVDYDEPLGCKIEAGKFRWFCPNITDKRFPFEQRGRRKSTLLLVNLGDARRPTTEVEAAIQQLQAVPSDLAQLLEVAKTFPELQRLFYIVALGSYWTYAEWLKPRSAYAPLLGRGSDCRWLSVQGFDHDWGGCFWFLAAREHRQ